MERHIRIIVLAFPLLLSVGATCSAPEYQISSLGALPSHASYYGPEAMNAAAQAVGRTWMTPGSPLHAYLYTPGSGITDLGALEGDSYSAAHGINSTGQVVGASSTEIESDDHAFLYTPGLGMSGLGTLGGTWSTAYAINNTGQVVGSSQTSNGEDHVFLYTPGSGMTDLQVLGRYGPYGINDVGQVVGSSTTSGSDTWAFLYAPGSGTLNLGTLVGGDYSKAYAVNNASQVIGYYSLGGSFYGFIYTPGSDIVNLGKWFIPQGISDAGQVVGYFYMPGSLRRAFVYTPGSGMVDLGTLGGAESQAYHVDAAGRIVGTSWDVYNEHLHIVAWDPVPEPSSLLALSAGIASLGGFVLRRRRPI